MCPLRRSGLNVRVVDGEMVVLDRRLHRIHQLNRSASCVWDCCDGRHGVQEIAAELMRVFDVDPVTAERDVTMVIRQFAEAGLLARGSVGSAVALVEGG